MTTPLEPGAWYITTDTFKRDGKVIAGPFPTAKAAADMRETIERHTGILTYWVDRAPNITIRGLAEVRPEASTD